MKAKYLAMLAAAGAALATFSTGGAQDQGTVLTPVLENLRKLKADLEARGAQKSVRPDAIQSAHRTRATEEAANEVARASQEFAISVGGGVNAKGIYGVDTRREYNDPRVTAAERLAADSTVVLVKSSDVTYSQDGRTFDLPGGNILDLAAGTGLCTLAQSRSYRKPEEPFYTEPNPGFCSGFRVGKNRILTAGHCIQTQADCANTDFVYGFNTSRDNPAKGIPKDNLFHCKSVVAGTLDPDGADWRLVEVDRDMTRGSDLALRHADREPKLSVGSELTVIGYPLGLPVKIANEGTVRGFGRGFLVTNLDTYEGNSGSAVFNSEELTKGQILVEGILVRGENDFEMTTPCYISKRCPSYGCRGEDVTLAAEINASVR